MEKKLTIADIENTRRWILKNHNGRFVYHKSASLIETFQLQFNRLDFRALITYLNVYEKDEVLFSGYIKSLEDLEKVEELLGLNNLE